MQYTKPTNTHALLILKRGELVVESLTLIAKQEKIENALISGLGAVKNIRCGYYDLADREYHFEEYPELCEVLNLSGNIMLKEGVPFVHLHATFSDTKNHAFGGHVVEMEVGVTLEIALTLLPSSHARRYDEETGLHLIDCTE